MPTRTRERPHLPIFTLYTLEQLARLLGYSESYLLSVKLGNHPLRERFRSNASKILPESEETLFGEEGE